MKRIRASSSGFNRDLYILGISFHRLSGKPVSTELLHRSESREQLIRLSIWCAAVVRAIPMRALPEGTLAAARKGRVFWRLGLFVGAEHVHFSRTSRDTLTVKWAGSRDKIFSPSGRGRTFFLTSLFIELITLFWNAVATRFARNEV
jgi:hypothetical protein